jgi:broad specificity phosphatase PhoE
LQRAQETATGINETLDLPVETLKFIDETTQSKQFYDSDSKKEYNWSIWMPKSPADQAPEGAESFGQIMERTQKLDAYLRKHAADKNILVVTHGTFLRFFLGHVLLGDDFTPHLVSLVWKIYTTNTGISMLEYREASGTYDAGWRVDTWNDQAHL